jgi:hypothetical protein
MNRTTLIGSASAVLLAVAVAGGMMETAVQAATALNGSIFLRPLTPTEITAYSLTNNVQGASGLGAVGVGQPAYLDALVNAAIAPSNITSVTWVLTNRPIGSAAVLAASPLGTNVPAFNPSDRVSLQVANRTMLRPDFAGQYKVTATIVTSGSGTTNLTMNITAGTYMGLQTCMLCHSGSAEAENIYATWTNTPHSSFFTRAINGQVSSHYSGACISCHTVGYDTNSYATNGGFDDVAKGLNWTFPSVLTNSNWAALPYQLKNLANIQCENCHGPGSEHAAALGQTNVSNWPRLGISLGAGDCAQCHDATPQEIKGAEWNNSRHAITTRTPSGPTRNNCVRCHTAGGFAGFLAHQGSASTYTTNTLYEAITCQACHDPHDASNPHQLRAGPNYTLPDGTAVTNAGNGGFCMNCHHSRNGAASNNIVNFQKVLPTWQGGSSFGVHDSPQGDMLEGANAITYGKDIPSSAHRYAVTNTCAGCHMQPVASTDPGYLKAGGHSFNMSYNVVSGGATNSVDMVNVCVQCHGPIDSFDMERSDYNGDGIIEGVQTEVQHLLDRLSTLLPNTNYVSGGNYVADGKVKGSSEISAKTNWPVRFLNGAYNWQFVNADASKGIHNAPYAVGLLKASIADLTGDANEDGLPDAWQVQYFYSTTNANAAPNACPAGDGVPNWLKYSLGLNPNVPGMVLPNGVVWANGSALSGSTNSIQIYTAAEVVFDTQVGKSYQIQSVGDLSTGWQNVGTPITGTGSAFSYVTPTRDNLQQFYRVLVSP